MQQLTGHSFAPSPGRATDSGMLARRARFSHTVRHSFRMCPTGTRSGLHLHLGSRMASLVQPDANE